MIQDVKKIIKEILEGNGEVLSSEINEQTNLRDLGLTSFDLATLTVMIEDEYDVDIFEDGIVMTVGEILERLKK
jgi:acyl carrier protein